MSERAVALMVSHKGKKRVNAGQSRILYIGQVGTSNVSHFGSVLRCDMRWYGGIWEGRYISNTFTGITPSCTSSLYIPSLSLHLHH